MKFVRGETRRGQSTLAQTRLYFSERLYHIAVKQNASVVTKGRQFFHRLENAGFVVRGHDRNQDRLTAHDALEFIQINPAAVSDGQESDVESLSFFQMFERVQDGMMFGACTDQVTAAVPMRARQTQDGQILCFSTAACKNEFMVRRQEASGGASVIYLARASRPAA